MCPWCEDGRRLFRRARRSPNPSRFAATLLGDSRWLARWRRKAYGASGFVAERSQRVGGGREVSLPLRVCVGSVERGGCRLSLVVSCAGAALLCAREPGGRLVHLGTGRVHRSHTQEIKCRHSSSANRECARRGAGGLTPSPPPRGVLPPTPPPTPLVQFPSGICV